MANPEHVERLLTSTVEEWNKWRADYRGVRPDLCGVQLTWEFRRARPDRRGDFLDLHGRNLRDACLVSTDFDWVKIGGADFSGADIHCAWWTHAVWTDQSFPIGLPDVIYKRIDANCDKQCITNLQGLIPENCARRCGEVLRPDPTHVELLLEGVNAWNEYRDSEPDFWPDLSGLDVHDFFEKRKDIDKRDLIDLTGANFEYAILRGTSFRNIRFDESSFIGADLRCSEWYNIEAAGLNFRDADLRNAKISAANLKCTDFSSANTTGLKLEFVDLSGANLREADLSGNSFWGSDLSGADLSRAHVCRSSFTRANLTGANLNSVRLWRASIFRREDVDAIAAVGNLKERTIHDVASLLEAISDVLSLKHNKLNLRMDELERSESRIPGSALYYRGHGEIIWNLRPTVFRKELYARNECDLMSELTSKHPEAFREDLIFFQRLVRARHFDLPTRLLDVTANPLTALYYASQPAPSGRDGLLQVFVVDRAMEYPFDSDTVSLVSNFTRLSHHQQRTLLTAGAPADTGSETRSDMGRDYREDRYEFAMKRLIHFIAREKPYWESRIKPTDLFKVLLVRPESSFPRLKAHDGAFLISAFHWDYDPIVVNRRVPGGGKYMRVVLRVPHGAKKHIRQQLKSVGVDEESLKADLGITAKAVADEILSRDTP